LGLVAAGFIPYYIILKKKVKEMEDKLKYCKGEEECERKILEELSLIKREYESKIGTLMATGFFTGALGNLLYDLHKRNKGV